MIYLQLLLIFFAGRALGFSPGHEGLDQIDEPPHPSLGFDAEPDLPLATWSGVQGAQRFQSKQDSCLLQRLRWGRESGFDFEFNQRGLRLACHLARQGYLASLRELTGYLLSFEPSPCNLYHALFAFQSPQIDWDAYGSQLEITIMALLNAGVPGETVRAEKGRTVLHLWAAHPAAMGNGIAYEELSRRFDSIHWDEEFGLPIYNFKSGSSGESALRKFKILFDNYRSSTSENSMLLENTLLQIPYSEGLIALSHLPLSLTSFRDLKLHRCILAIMSKRGDRCPKPQFREFSEVDFPIFDNLDNQKQWHVLMLGVYHTLYTLNELGGHERHGLALGLCSRVRDELSASHPRAMAQPRQRLRRALGDALKDIKDARVFEYQFAQALVKTQPLSLSPSWTQLTVEMARSKSRVYEIRDEVDLARYLEARMGALSSPAISSEDLSKMAQNALHFIRELRDAPLLELLRIFEAFGEEAFLLCTKQALNGMEAKPTTATLAPTNSYFRSQLKTVSHPFAPAADCDCCHRGDWLQLRRQSLIRLRALLEQYLEVAETSDKAMLVELIGEFSRFNCLLENLRDQP